MKKVIAQLTKWSGEKIEYEIKKEWAQDIADAVKGQFTFIDNKKGFGIKGDDFAFVTVYEVPA